VHAAWVSLSGAQTASSRGCTNVDLWPDVRARSDERYRHRVHARRRSPPESSRHNGQRTVIRQFQWMRVRLDGGLHAYRVGPARSSIPPGSVISPSLDHDPLGSESTSAGTYAVICYCPGMRGQMGQGEAAGKLLIWRWRSRRTPRICITRGHRGRAFRASASSAA